MKNKRLFKRTFAVVSVLLITASFVNLFFLKPKSAFADSTFSLNEGYGTVVSDSTGNVSGTITNAVWKQEDLCKVGKCLYFDGTGDLVSFADNSNLDFGASNAFTLEGWLRTPDITSGQRTILAKHNATAGGYKVYMDSNGYLIFGIDDDSTWTPEDTASTATTAFDDNRWHFFSAVKTDTSITIYVDGVQYQTDSSLTATGSLANANSFYVGMDGNGTSNGFSGFLDEIRILKSPKTTAEVKTDYAGQSKTITGAGPVGWWKMDEASWTNNCSTPTAMDSSGNDLNLTSCPSTTGPTGGSVGKFGNAGTFDGSNDYLESANTTLNIFPEVSVSVWVKILSTPASEVIIVDRTNSNTGYYISYNTSNKAKFRIGTGTTYFTITGNITIPNNTWTHLEGTADSNGNTALYVNGVVDVVGSAGAPLASETGQNFRIGTRSVGTYINADVDEVRVYNYKRNQQQILEDMQGYLPAGVAASFEPENSHLSDGLVGYWKMDETASPAIDSSGNGNSGTWNGNVAAVTGKYGPGISLDGTTDYLNIGSPSVLDNLSQLSLSTWVYPNSDAGRVIDKQLNDNTTGWKVEISSTGDIQFTVDYDGATDLQVDANSNLSSATWHHVFISWDGTSDAAGVKIIVDGVLQTSFNINTSGVGNRVDDNAMSIGVGCRISGTNQCTSGRMDEMRIYNRALSDFEGNELFRFAPGPAGYWKLDENTGTTANDSSGNGFVGTLTNNPAWRNGKNGGAVSFDGVDDYVDFGDPFYSDILTIEAWFKPVAVDGATYKNIVVKRNGSGVTAGNNEYEIVINSTRTIAWNAWDSGGVGISSMSSSTAVELNKWHHVAVTYSGVSRMAYLYIDGVVEDTDTPTGAIGDTSSKLQFGARSGSNDSRYFNGLIDHVEVYNYARSAGQVSEAFGSGVVSPVAYWKFDEGSGTTANDSASTIGSSESLTLSTATSSWSNSGKTGKAFSAGGSRWLTRSDDPYLDFVNSESFSISFWMKSSIASAANPSATEYIVNKPPSGAANGGYAVYANTSGQICFGIDDDNTSFPEDSSCTTSDVYDNTWHHITAIKTEASSIMVYVDAVPSGTPDVSISASVNTLANTSTFYVGSANAVNDTDDFNGDLDEMQIFRGAITADQVKVLYGGNSQTVLGATSVSSVGVVDRSSAGEYCVPGDTASCLPPVGHWKMDENTGIAANDSSGNGSVAAFSGSPTWTNGKTGSALSFNGSSDYLNASSPTILDDMSSMTISAWIYPNVQGTSSRLVSKNSSSGWIFRISSTNQLGFSASTAGSDVDKYSGTDKILQKQWYHVTATWTRLHLGSSINLYINGVLVPTGSSTDGTAPVSADTSSNVYVATSGALSSYFNGKIDDVKIYNYVRTPAQIAWDYNRGKPVAWWKMDECRGTSVNDSMGNVAVGTISFGATGNTAVGTCGSGTATEMWNDGTTGKYVGSLGFDGGDDAVSVPNTAAINFNGMAGITMSAWIKPTSAGETSRGRVVDKDGAVNGYQMYVTDTGNVGFAIDTATGDYLEAKSTSGLLTFNTWHSVVTTYNSADSSYVVYIDGQSQPTAIDHTGSGTIVDNGGSLYIGNRAAGDRTFDGQIDDVRIYNYALTGSQVKTVANEGSAVRFGQ